MQHGVRLVAFLLFAAASAFAQQGTGTFSGSVLDPSGASIPGAKVEVRNVETNATFSATTNESGFYTAPGQPVGRYVISAESPGFKRTERSGVTLQVNQNAQINITLEIGETVETVEVSGEAPLVDTGGATLGTVIERKSVSDLPLNGRQALALTLLTAGVVSNAGPTASGFGDRGIQLSSISINGSPNSMNGQMLDGNNNTLTYVGEVGVPPAVDSVQEFKVQSGTMSSEFGFTAGGSINLVTRSGTNQIHGTAYEFLRNDKLDARNTFSNDKLPLRYNQYGFSIGGPFIKNKTFGFFNYEKYLLRTSSPRIRTVPIAPFRTGDFGELKNSNGSFRPIFDPSTTRANPDGGGQVRDPYPNNVVPTSNFDPVAMNVLEFWPLPNRTPTNANTFSNNFQDAANRKVDWTQWNTKIDHRFSDKHSMFFRFSQARHEPSADEIFTDPTVGRNRFDDQKNKNIMLSDTYTFSPTIINDFRIGLARQIFNFTAFNAFRDWPSRIGLPADIPQDQMPDINFGFGTIGGGAVGARGSLNWDIQNMTTLIKGAHTIKLGVNYRDIYGGNRQGAGLSGLFRFGGLTDNPQSPGGTGSNMAQFLTGDVQSGARIDRILGNAWQGWTTSFFIQDDWRVTSRLTLNLGLRYDYQNKPVERWDGHINFDPNCTQPNGLQGCTVFAGFEGQPRSFYDQDRNDFGPRFGFAYDLTGKGRTIFRGGYGIFYPSIYWRNFFGDTNLFSTTRTTYTSEGSEFAAFQLEDGFPFPWDEAPGRTAGPGARNGQSVGLTESDKTTPMTQQWNLSMQHQLGDWAFEATYAGNKGNNFVASGYNLNQLHPDTIFELGQRLNDRVPNPNAGLVPGGLGASTISLQQSLAAFPHYSSVSIRNPRLGNYISHQLQLSAKKRLADGLLMNVAFTGGKRISDSLANPVNFGSVEQVNENGFQNGRFDRAASRSVDPTDVSRRLVISGLYQLPFGQGQKFDAGNGAANKIIGGWQINVIGTLQNGVPITVRGANNFLANRPNSTGVSAKLPKDQRTAERWFDTQQFVNPPDFTFGNVGRAIPDVRHPGTVNWDLSFIKDTYFGERFNLQFRAEAFNFMNHVNYRLANDAFVAGADGFNASGNFGTITAAREPRRLQFGLKLIF